MEVCEEKTVAKSSTDAEFKVIENTVTEILWFQNLLVGLGVSSPHKPLLLCDNVGATYILANHVFHSKIKHVALETTLFDNM